MLHHFAVQQNCRHRFANPSCFEGVQHAARSACQTPYLPHCCPEDFERLVLRAVTRIFAGEQVTGHLRSNHRVLI